MAAAGGLVSAAGNGVISAMATQAVMRIINGNFNPNYNKEDRKRMRYIQQKYCASYGAMNTTDDITDIIKNIDPQSKLLMVPDGVKPANPFPDERAFEDSLQLNIQPVSGHEGRFAASHALSCIGVIIEYQVNRRARVWVPGVISPGRPNDYINLFLEEIKVWCRTQLTLDNLRAEELVRRDTYLTKLKNDNLYWVFPSEREVTGIHKVIEFVHQKVKSALDIVSREEKNCSLQSLFRDLNDHTTNAFEFGKNFLGYILCHHKQLGANLVTNRLFNGKTIETGKLHKLLEQTTGVVFQTYVKDMQQTHDRMALDDSQTDISYPPSRPLDPSGRRRADSMPAQSTMGTSLTLTVAGSSAGASNGSAIANREEPTSTQYIVDISDWEESKMGIIQYIVELTDPKGNRWVVNKTYLDFEVMHKTITADVRNAVSQTGSMALLNLGNIFPDKLDSKFFHKEEEVAAMCDKLCRYLIEVFGLLHEMSSVSTEAVRSFSGVRYLTIGSKSTLKYAEAVPSIFLHMKAEFNRQLLMKPGSKPEENNGERPMNKNMVEFRTTWGIEWVVLIFDAYALLQRMATILGWTLEINHFFVSMFGNTLTFSQLPLRDILVTQKDILTKFLTVATKIYDYACKLNADQKYKWHKNMQMSENQLHLVRHHVDKAIAVINCIETEHLDYDAQLKRLMDVLGRFQPLMNRVDGNLVTIQSELGLPIHSRNPRGSSAIDSASVNVLSGLSGALGNGSIREIRDSKDADHSRDLARVTDLGEDGRAQPKGQHSSPVDSNMLSLTSGEETDMSPSCVEEIRDGEEGLSGVAPTRISSTNKLNNSTRVGASAAATSTSLRVPAAAASPPRVIVNENSRPGSGDAESQVCIIC